jgi:hypothetical protein
MGNTKLAVLPVPVWAEAIKSCPFNARGMEAAWIGVGALKPAFKTHSRVSGESPRDSQVAGVSGATPSDVGCTVGVSREGDAWDE